MSVAACPRCEAQVTVPPGAPISARAKCPLCDAEFSLGEIYARLPPMLLIVDLPVMTPAGYGSPSGVPMSAMMGAEASMTPGAGAFESLFESSSDDGDVAFADEKASSERMGDGSLGGDDHGEFDFAPAEDDTGAGMLGTSTLDAAPSSSATATPAARPKKKGRNPIKELFKVGVGGVVGIALGWYIALWTMGQDFGDLSKHFPNWMAWALPAKFKPPVKEPVKEPAKTDHNASDNTANGAGDANAGAGGDETPRIANADGAGADRGADKGAEEKGDAGSATDGNPADGNTTDANPTDNGAAQKGTPADNAGDAKKPVDELPAPGTEDKPAKEADPATPADGDKPASDAPQEDDGGKAPAKDPHTTKQPKVDDPVIVPPSEDDKPATDKPATEKPADKPVVDPAADDPLAPPGDDPAAKAPPVKIPANDPAAEGKPGLKIDAPIDAAEVAKSLSAAQATVAVLNPEDAAAKKAFTKEKYDAFGKLCESINAAAHGATDADNVNAAGALAATVAKDDDSAHVLAQLANAWLSRKRGNDGVVLTGAIKSVETKDGLTRVTIELPAVSKLAARTETIVMPANETVAAGDQVVIAGTVVEKPQEAIRGFTGTNDRVIWGAAMQKRK